MRRVRRLILVGFVLVLVAGAAGLLLQDTAPLSAEAVRHKSDAINEAAAVSVPHGFDDGAVRRAHLRLFEQVESGTELSAADSVAYRLAYQEIIWRKQSTLRRFDRQLTVIPDLEMTRRNNVEGLGVAGSHDHHDVSMRMNVLALERALQTIQDPSSSSPARIRAAISSYKDTTDILTHLATVPHTKSIEYQVPSDALSPLRSRTEAMLRDFKNAQFAAVNGPAYWESVWRGLDAFDALLLHVQTTITTRLSRSEQRLAGRWDSAQSLGRWLTSGATPRRARPPRPGS